MDTDNLAFWVALHQPPGLPARVLIALLQHFGTVENIRAADRSALRRVLGEHPETIRGILRGPDPGLLDDIHEWLEQPGRRLR